MANYAIQRRVRSYYKYEYRDWTQPVLTANGTLGGTSFACFVGSNYSGNPAYYAFDGKDTTAWASNLTDTQDYIGFYNPEPLLVSEIVCTNKVWITGLWEVYGSNDNVDYELLASGENTDATDGSTFTIDLSSNEKPYKYYKIQCLTTLANQRVGMGEIKITAQELLDIIEVPSSSITDFGSYKYFKNVVTTKYWKEIETTVNGVVYACYRIYASNGYVGWYHYYAKMPIGSSLTAYYKTGDIEDLWQDFTNDASQITPCSANSFTAIDEANATLTKPPSSRHNGKVCDRYPEGDAYGDIVTTETVEGTPEDYTYTTEEIVPVEVSADDDYDYTEFVPSTQYDYHVDNNKLYTPTRRRREYYKYGTEPNVGIVGSPTIVDGVASGFTTANYLTTPKVFNPLGSEVECVFKVNLAALNRTNPMISQGANVQFNKFFFVVMKDGRIRFNAGTGSTTIVRVDSNVVLEINKDYWLKLHIKDNVYSLYYSLDGVDYIFDNSVEDADIIREMTTTAYIGANRDPAAGSSSYFNGSIDLRESYVKINGEDWWHGTKIVKTTEDDYEWYVDRNVAYDLVYKPYDVISETFNISDEIQTYVVPEDVYSLNIFCAASAGYSATGGDGGAVKCDLIVTPGQTLYVTVGSRPTTYNTAVYNASDIRIDGTELENRIIVAGGGGTGRSNKGGAGGGLVGGDAVGVGYQKGAFGGTQEAGGGASYRSGGNTDGWAAGAAGTYAMGGNGAKGSMYGGTVLGGCGGAGYYGGGGGGVYDINKVGITHAGGGGGSSYTDASLCKNVVHYQGVIKEDGYVRISYIKEREI